MLYIKVTETTKRITGLLYGSRSSLAAFSRYYYAIKEDKVLRGSLNYERK